MLVGLISDTHGLMRADALAALHGVALILHAGDVGGQGVLRELEGVAPVRAVFGNVDDPVFGLPQRLALTLDGLKVHVSHGHEVGSPTPATLAHRYSADVIVFGHTHKPLIETIGRTLVVNPGAAGARRFSLRPSVALLTIQGGTASARLVHLEG
ncbi:MAG: metallophosphoesterase family protein [Vicinamibacterales bacterium]